VVLAGRTLAECAGDPRSAQFVDHGSKGTGESLAILLRRGYDRLHEQAQRHRRTTVALGLPSKPSAAAETGR